MVELQDVKPAVPSMVQTIVPVGVPPGPQTVAREGQGVAGLAVVRAELSVTTAVVSSLSRLTAPSQLPLEAVVVGVA